MPQRHCRILTARSLPARRRQCNKRRAVRPGFDEVIIPPVASNSLAIVRNANGETQVVPTVPLSAQHASPFAFPEQPSLERDARFVGKIKWYVHPLVFGGDASAQENTTWVTHEQHRQLVAWWNAKYQEVKGKGADA